MFCEEFQNQTVERRGNSENAVRRLLQRRPQVGNRLVAVHRELAQATRDYALHLRSAFQGGRLIMQNGHQYRKDGGTLEGLPAGQQFVEQRAEGEDVGPRVHRLALRLLGRHVAGGAEDRPGLRLRGGLIALAQDLYFGQSEIQQFDTGLGQQDVGRLQVPMRDALLVRCGERIANLQGIRQHLLRPKQAP